MTAFLLTWKETGWPYEKVRNLIEAKERQGYADEPWRLIAHRQAKIGDRVWLLKQGTGPKVIFGAGQITGTPARTTASNGKRQWMVPVRFSHLVDPKQTFLIGEEHTARLLPSTMIRAQASGYPIDDSISDALLDILESSSPLLDPLASTDEIFDPRNIEDARRRIIRAIAERRGQRRFRMSLLRAYGDRCAISNCDVVDVLDAAHIYPYRGPATNSIANGLLLRSDLHNLFDCGLISVNPTSMCIVVARKLRMSEYGALHGKPLRLPEDAKFYPSKSALELHYKTARRDV